MNLPILAITLVIIFQSCSSLKNKEGQQINQNQPSFSKNAILNLVRTSYIKGCVEVKTKILQNKKLYTFNQCRDLATTHTNEMEYILYQQEPSVQKNN